MDGTARPVDAEAVADHLHAVRARIASAGARPEDVTIVAVTKTFGPDAVVAAVGAGLRDIGENYAQEALTKVPDIERLGARLHVIGHVQVNKVRSLAGHVALWQTVDRPALVAELARRDPGARVLVQVNVSGEAQKSGCSPEDAPALVDTARDQGLDVLGLMTVGVDAEIADPRPGFARLRALVDRLGLHVCSMGMTGDLELAVAEGATMVRIGTALFGARTSAPRP